jgi:hypothetical protein
MLHALLWHERGLAKDDQRSLLPMTHTRGICFVHRYGDSDDETEYVAPDLLPEGPDALAARWERPGEPLEAAFAYPLMSPSIVRSMLSALGELAGSTALCWRYGLCLYDAQSRAHAIVDEVPDAESYGGQIRIRTKGDGAETLLARLVERIERINAHSVWSGQLLRTAMSQRGDTDPLTIAPATPPPSVPDKPEAHVSYAQARERQDPCGKGSDAGAGSDGPLEDSPKPSGGMPPSGQSGASNAQNARGHGRRAAADYPGAETVICTHEAYQPGDRCPLG